MPRDAFVLKIQRELCHPKYARKVSGLSRNRPLGPVSRKSRKLFRPEKPFVKLRSANSVKPFFSHFAKGIKIKINAKFRASRRLRFEDTKRIMSREIRPKSFGTFEKRAPGLQTQPRSHVMHFSRWAFCLRVRDSMFSHGYIRCYAPARRFLAKCKIKHGGPPFEKFCAVAFNNCVEC